MKLIGDLKKNVEKAADLKEAKEIIREAGVELTDEELEQVAGEMSVTCPEDSLKHATKEQHDGVMHWSCEKMRNHFFTAPSLFFMD